MSSSWRTATIPWIFLAFWGFSALDPQTAAGCYYTTASDFAVKRWFDFQKYVWNAWFTVDLPLWSVRNDLRGNKSWSRISTSDLLGNKWQNGWTKDWPTPCMLPIKIKKLGQLSFLLWIIWEVSNNWVEKMVDFWLTVKSSSKRCFDP